MKAFSGLGCIKAIRIVTTTTMMSVSMRLKGCKIVWEIGMTPSNNFALMTKLSGVDTKRGDYPEKPECQVQPSPKYAAATRRR